MSYATGKYALGLCDRCGFRFLLSNLHKEWTGFKVCGECYEAKHPQLEVHSAGADPVALFEPRPDTDKEVGEGYILTNNDNIISSAIPGYQMTGNVGEVTITTS